MPNLTGLTTNFFPTPNEGFTTTTSGPVDSSSATVVPLNSVSGLTNGSVFTGLIDPGNAKERAFTGVVDTGGSQITSVVFTTGTNATHTTGATVVDYVTGTHIGQITKGISVSIDQDGTLKAGAVDNTAVIGSGVVEQTNLKEKLTDYSFDFVASGCVWSGDSYGASRAASMTSGVVYIGGVKVTVSAVTARSFTASRDTYIDVGSDGVVDYNEVTNNAASPALAASHIRLGIIVTDATDIQDVGSVNQGQENKILPIASSVPYQVTDSLGNLICPRDPRRKVLGYRQITADFTTASASVVQVTGLSVPVIIPTDRKIKVTAHCPRFFNSSASVNSFLDVWQGTVGSGTQLTTAQWTTASVNQIASVSPSSVESPTTASLTFNVGAYQAGGGTVTVSAATTRPTYLLVELV